jgi:hypothetical protein
MEPANETGSLNAILRDFLFDRKNDQARRFH